MMEVLILFFKIYLYFIYYLLWFLEKVFPYILGVILISLILSELYKEVIKGEK